MENIYVIRNICNTPVVIKFINGQQICIRPNGLMIWRGPESNFITLQQHLLRGEITVIFMSVDHSEKPIDISWQSEGF